MNKLVPSHKLENILPLNLSVLPQPSINPLLGRQVAHSTSNETHAYEDPACEVPPPSELRFSNPI